jgi:hypothetical protein
MRRRNDESFEVEKEKIKLKKALDDAEKSDKMLGVNDI